MTLVDDLASFHNLTREEAARRLAEHEFSFRDLKQAEGDVLRTKIADLNALQHRTNERLADFPRQLLQACKENRRGHPKDGPDTAR